MAAEDIFGPDIGSLKGKTTRRRPHRVNPVSVLIPPGIHEKYKEVTLCGDIMFMNGIPFLITTSCHLHFSTVEAIPDQTVKSIVTAVKNIQKVYTVGGFRLRWALMDGQFESAKGDIAEETKIDLNVTARDEHVGDIERHIRTVKERVRSTYNTLPFTRLPKRLVMEMVKGSVFWLNSFLHPLGVSDTLSPRTIVTGKTLDHNRHCQYEFGEYVQTHEEHDNTMLRRTVGALALRPTGNIQGGWYFLSLDTG